MVALEKKGQFRKASPGPGVKMFREKLQGEEGEGTFS